MNHDDFVLLLQVGEETEAVEDALLGRFEAFADVLGFCEYLEGV